MALPSLRGNGSCFSNHDKPLLQRSDGSSDTTPCPRLVHQLCALLFQIEVANCSMGRKSWQAAFGTDLSTMRQTVFDRKAPSFRQATEMIGSGPYARPRAMGARAGDRYKLFH